MKKLREKLNKAIFDKETAKHFSKKISSFKTDEEHISYCMELCNKYNINPSDIEQKQKCIEESKKWRDKGNLIFISNPPTEQLEEACSMYTTSLAFAPTDDSENMSIIYANRSAVLIRLKKYQECLKNIEHCLNLNYPDRLKVKVFLRRTECLAILKSPDAKKSYDETLNWIEVNFSGKELTTMKKKLEECYHKRSKVENEDFETDLEVIFQDFNYETSNEEVPVSSDAVELRHSKTKGRHLSATRHIRAGEILVKESSYCSIYKVKKRYYYCWMCQNFLWNSFPCENCVHAVFCSEKCKEEAWVKFHDVECEILSTLMSLKAEFCKRRYAIAGLRVVIKAVKELGSIEGLMEEVKKVEDCKDPRLKGFSEDGKFHSDKYRSFYSLMTNTNKMDFIDFWDDRTFYAVIITYYLATTTSFFGEKLPKDWAELIKNEQFIFIGSLIFRNIQILFANCLTDDEMSQFQQNIQEWCLAVYPFTSLVNHSCYPNAQRIYRNGEQILFAIRPILKGQQVVTSYGVNMYYAMGKILRGYALKERYVFTCKCIACKEDWSQFHHDFLYDELVEGGGVMDIANELIAYHDCDDSTSKITADFYRYLSLLSDAIEKASKHEERFMEFTFFMINMVKAFEFSRMIPIKNE